MALPAEDYNDREHPDTRSENHREELLRLVHAYTSPGYRLSTRASSSSVIGRPYAYATPPRRPP